MALEREIQSRQMLAQIRNFLARLNHLGAHPCNLRIDGLLTTDDQAALTRPTPRIVTSSPFPSVTMARPWFVSGKYAGSLGSGD